MKKIIVVLSVVVSLTACGSSKNLFVRDCIDRGNDPVKCAEAGEVVYGNDHPYINKTNS